MTLPDSLKKMRNAHAAVAVALLAASFSCAFSASFWNAVLDYWLVWMSIASGVGGIGNTIAAVIMNSLMIDSLRSN